MAAKLKAVTLDLHFTDKIESLHVKPVFGRLANAVNELTPLLVIPAIETQRFRDVDPWSLFEPYCVVAVKIAFHFSNWPRVLRCMQWAFGKSAPVQFG